MLTIEEIKHEAELAAVDVDLNWERLEDPQEAEVLNTQLNKCITLLPDLESLYTKITSGKSVVFPDAETSLSFDEIEQYADLVAEELHAAYMLLAIKDKYDKVNNIIALSGSM